MTAPYYTEFEPDPRLKTHVACYWLFRTPAQLEPREHTIPPDGSVSLSCRIPPGVVGLVGPCTTPVRTPVGSGETYWGCRFWPGAATSLLDVPAEPLRNAAGPATAWLNEAWLDRLAGGLRGARSEAGARQTLDAALLGRLEDATPLDAAVMEAVFVVLARRGQVTIAELAERSALSDRQLRRRFRREVGLTPKELVRARRVRAAMIGALEETQTSWIELALEHGYSDQAHLVREFRRLVGLSPVQARAYFRGLDHGRYER
jgi:AraC-like DNA-binding protein